MKCENASWSLCHLFSKVISAFTCIYELWLLLKPKKKNTRKKGLVFKSGQCSKYFKFTNHRVFNPFKLLNPKERVSYVL